MDKIKLLKKFNARCENTLMETLKIVYTDIGDDFLEATMPVTKSVFQPMGILHGGATAALAESVGSAASSFFIDHKTQIIKGISLNINHLKSVKEGIVTARATVIHKGRTTHLWQVKITDDKENLISECKMTNIVLEKQ